MAERGQDSQSGPRTGDQFDEHRLSERIPLDDDFNISFIRNELRAPADGAATMYTSASWNSDYTGYDYMAQIGQSLGLICGYQFDGALPVVGFRG